MQVQTIVAARRSNQTLTEIENAEKQREMMERERPRNQLIVLEALKEELSNGLTISFREDRGHLAGTIQPKTLYSNENAKVSDVVDGFAWIEFKLGPRTYRTEKIADRDALLAWAKLPAKERPAYSNAKEMLGKLGPSNVNFYTPKPLVLSH